MIWLFVLRRKSPCFLGLPRDAMPTWGRKELGLRVDSASKPRDLITNLIGNLRLQSAFWVAFA